MDKNEFEIIINDLNTWKDEIMARMSLEKAVRSEINQMPQKFMKFKNVPYHLYPFSEQLNSNIKSHRYYILSASVAYYEELHSQEPYVSEKT